MSTKKNFILDTNVILHDYKCLTSFEENDIYLPIVVLEELDRFKKGSEQINYNAREFIRNLEEISSEDLFKEGVQLGANLGRLFVIIGNPRSQRVKDSFIEKISDNCILGSTDYIQSKYPDMKTILVTKDVNLRMKAKSLGIVAQDYKTETVTNFDVFEREHLEFFIGDVDVIDCIYAGNTKVTLDELHLDYEFLPNDCFILKSSKNSVLARYNPFTESVEKIKKSKNFGIEPRNAEQSFAFEVLNDPEIKLVAVTGKAGTGKTLLALASALRQKQDYRQILLARPIIALSNQNLGFLPGDAKDKISPYMQPLFDNLNVIKRQFEVGSSDSKKIEEMLKNDELAIEALAFIRGRSLSDMFCIIDEAQNLTPHEVKTIITRAGENTKMIFTGDIQQIDHPYLDASSNGLVYLIDRMKKQKLFAHVNLVKGERSELSELASNLL